MHFKFNKLNSIKRQHSKISEGAFTRSSQCNVWKKYSDVTPPTPVIINIFISNCNLMTHFFLVTVTDYNYFVTKLLFSYYLLPNTGGYLV